MPVSDTRNLASGVRKIEFQLSQFKPWCDFVSFVVGAFCLLLNESPANPCYLRESK
jgi:hypothetical protein